MAEKIFADGLIIKTRRENAPEFIKAHISIKVEELIAFLKKHKKEDGWCNLDVCQSQGGKLYCSLNTFQPKREIGPGDSPF